MGFWGVFIIVVCAGLFIAFLIAIAQGADIGEFFEDLVKVVLWGFVSIGAVIGVFGIWIFGILASLALPLAFVVACLFLVKWIFF